MRISGDLDDGDFAPCLSRKSAWGTDAVAEIESIRDPWGPASFVVQPALDRLMLRVAIRSGATRVPHSFVRAEALPEGWALDLSDGSTIYAGFVIDASGRTAAFARRTGATRRRIDRLVAAAVRLNPSGESRGFTFVESVADGWWYTGLAPNGHASVIFFTDSDLPGARNTAHAGGWNRVLDETAHSRFLVSSATPEPLVLCASSEYLSPCAQANWAAVGDAQATYDPLSSEGLLQALESSEQASKAAIAYFDGDRQATRNYRATRELVYLKYLSDRALVYGMELRWPQAPFWKRRSAYQATRNSPSHPLMQSLASQSNQMEIA
jgi:flavin-dependent dehydrogenase